jgi:hypothetical protein
MFDTASNNTDAFFHDIFAPLAAKILSSRSALLIKLWLRPDQFVIANVLLSTD